MGRNACAECGKEHPIPLIFCPEGGGRPGSDRTSNFDGPDQRTPIGVANEPTNDRDFSTSDAARPHQKLSVLDRLRSLVTLHPSRSDPHRSRLEQIRSLEAQAWSARSLDLRAEIFDRLGDLYTLTGERVPTLESYGRAIDGYLESGRLQAAETVCRKLTNSWPDVVRTHGTLAFLCLSRGEFEDGRREIDTYIRTARHARRERFAVKRLHLMAEGTKDFDIRFLLGESLLELDDAAGANAMFGAAYADRNNRSGLDDAPLDKQREQWAALLRVPLTGLTGQDDPPTVFVPGESTRNSSPL